MAKGFNLTAEINLRGPSNIRQIVSDIRRQLGTIDTNINVNISAQTNKQISTLDRSFKSFNSTLAQTRTLSDSTARSLSQLGNAARVLGSSLQNIPQNMSQISQAANKVATDNQKVKASTQQMSSEFAEFGRQSALAVRRFAAFATVTGIIFKVSNAIGTATKEFIDFNKALVQVAQVTDTPISSLDFLVNNITSLSTKLGVASKDLIEVSRTLSQAGLSAKDTSAALEALALSALAPSFDNLNNTVEGSIALMRQFGIGANDLAGALGSINAVAAKFAVEAGDIVTAIQRTGGVFASASKGVSEGTDALNEFVAVFTSVRATTRESAETIATGLRTIFTRIQREDTINALKGYGVALTDLEGKFVGPYEAVRRLAQGLNQLDPREIRFSRIVEELGGFRQIGKVIPLIQQFTTAQQALSVAQRGSGSLARDAITAQLSLANQFSKVREEFTALIRSIGQTEGFRDMVRLTLDLTSNLIRIADAAKGALPALTAIFAIKGFQALTQFGAGFLGGIRRGNAKGLNQGGKILGFKDGGSVPGYGRGDKVPAMLEPGEVVMSNRAVSKYGRGNLVKMNRMAFKNGKGPEYNPEERTVRAHAIDPKRYGKKISKEEYTALSGGRKIGTKIQSIINGDDLEVIPNFTIALPGSFNKAMRRGGEGGIPLPEFKKALDSPYLLYGSNKGKISTRTKRQSISKIPRNIEDEIRKAFKEEVDRTAEGPDPRFINRDDQIYRFADIAKSILTREKLWSTRPLEMMSRSPTSSGGTQSREFVPKEIASKLRSFKNGGIAKRNIGYIDYDVIANPANEAAVAKGMERSGVTGPRLYADYLTQLAVKARKDSNLQKLRAVYGVAGSGKTTLARGQGTDQGKLRSTTRFPVLTPEDIQKANEVLILSSSVSKDKLDSIFSEVDRAYTLSSTTPAEKERIKAQRASRDTTGIGLEGRTPGGTMGVGKDTAVGEALLQDRLGSRSVVLGRSDSGKLRRKRGDELVQIIKKKIGFTWGGFAPMTVGHESILDAAAAQGISPKDFIFLVGANEGINDADASSYRTAIFDQDARVLLARAGAGARGATVLPKARDFETPLGFDVSGESGRRKVVLPSKGSKVFVGEEKGANLTAKYKEAGYDVASMARTEGISATKVRELIEKGDLGGLQKLLSPGVYDLISNNIGRIQNRAKVLPDIIAQVKQGQDVKLADIEKAIKAVGISRIDKKKLDDPEYAAKVQVLEELRSQRDKVKSSSALEPYKLLDELARSQPEKYGLDFSTGITPTTKPIRTVGATQRASIGGLIQRFMAGGEAEETAPWGDTATVPEILRLLSFDGAAKIGRVANPRELLKRKKPTEDEKAKIKAIRDEATKTYNRRIGAGKGVQTRLAGQGLKFAAVGMFGGTFPDETYDAEGTKGIRKVLITAAIMDRALAEQLDVDFGGGIESIAQQAAEKTMIGNITKGLLGGKQAEFDFDRTLAVGADDIASLKDFRDPTIVQEKLKNASLTRLGRSLVDLVKAHPEILPNMRIVTARSQSTVPLVQRWLADKGLGLSDSQFVGVGGDAQIVSESDIPALKAAQLRAGSLFVDDSGPNIMAAEASGKNIEAYQYGAQLTIPNPNAEASVKGILFEKMIQNLGGPGAIAGLGFDYPKGLGPAAKYFGIDPDIPTDAKRTIVGAGTIKDNVRTYLKAMGYAGGGMIMGKGRGKKGAKGARDVIEPISSETYLKWAQGIYDEYDKDPSLVMTTDELGIRMPPEIALANKLLTQHALQTGGAGLSVGKRFVATPEQYIDDALRPYLVPNPNNPNELGFYEDVVAKFGRAKAVSAAATKKLGKAEALKAVEARMETYTGTENAISEFKKSGVLNVSSPIMDYLIQSINNPDNLPLDSKGINSIKKKLTKSNVDAFNALVGSQKTPVSVQGQRTKLGEVFNAILETYGSDVSDLEVDNITRAMGEKLNIGGLVQKFAFGGKTDGPGFEEVRKQIMDKYPEVDFRISKRKKGRGFGYNLLGALKTDGGLLGSKGLQFEQPSNLQKLIEVSDKMATSLINPQELAVGGLADATSEMASLMGGLYGNRRSSEAAPAKKQKDFGKIGLAEDGDMITASYYKNNQRSGYVYAYKMKDNLYNVGLSKATSGYGPRLYDVIMEAVSEKGAMLTSDRSSVSGDAKKVWEYYFKNRGDVKKTPLEPEDWTKNQSLIDPKLYGRKETWPPPTDPAWVLQSGYSKSPNLINDPNSVVRNKKKSAKSSGQMALEYFGRANGGRLGFADGGSVPALVSNGEAYVPPKLAKKIGYGTLNRMNQADRNGMGRFSSGGISVFQGPGSGTSDSIPTSLPVGSFIIREKATKALGLNKGGSIGIKSFKDGGTNYGPVDKFTTVTKAATEALQKFITQTSVSALFGKSNPVANPSAYFGAFRAAETGDQDAAKFVAEEQRKQVNAIAAQIRKINNSIPLTDAVAAAERRVADAWGGLYKEIKETTQSQNVLQQSSDQLSQTQDGASKERNKFNFSGLGTALAFTGPMLAGQLGETIGGATGAGVAGVASNVSTFTSIGSQFGGIGAIGGLLVGLATSIDSWGASVANFEATATSARIDQIFDTTGKAFERMSVNINDKGAFNDIVGNFQRIQTEETKLAAFRERANAPSTLTGIGRRLGILSSPTAETVGGEKAVNQQKAAAVAQQFLESQIQATQDYATVSQKLQQGGSSFDQLYAAILEADTAYAIEVEKIKQSTDAEDTKNQKINELTAQKTQEIRTSIETRFAEIERAKASKKLTQALDLVSVSLNRTFATLNQSINAASFSLEKASESIQNIVNDSANFSNRLNSLNILENPRAYSRTEQNAAISQSAQFAGQDRQFVEQFARFSLDIEDSMTTALNQAKAGGVTDPNVIGDRLSGLLTSQLDNIFGPQLGESIRSQFKPAIAELVKGGNKLEDISIQDILENIPGLNQQIQASKQVFEALSASGKFLENAFNFVGSSAKEYASLQDKLSENVASAQNIIAQSNLSFQEAMGKRITLEQRKQARTTTSATRAGVRPQDLNAGALSNRRDLLLQQKENIEKSLDNLRQSFDKRDLASSQQFIGLNRALALTESSIKKTNQALESLPQNIEQNINDIISEISRIQQKSANITQASTGFGERLLGSTPQELQELGTTFNVLNSALSGNVNTIQQSQAAQLAYRQALTDGKTQQEAMLAAQQAFAGQTRNVLTLFNELSSMSGLEEEELRPVRAELFKNLASSQGSGLQNNPIFQTIISRLEQPPEESREIKELKALLASEQRSLVDVTQRINQTTLDKQTAVLDAANQKFIDALSSIEVRFNTEQLRSMGLGLTPPGRVPQAQSKGGVVYASDGTYVNFAPKGTDTIPAMLTPGEFVVNAKATKNNLGLLRSINSSNGSGKTYSRGGVVYAADGTDTDDAFRKHIEAVRARSAATNATLGAPSVTAAAQSATATPQVSRLSSLRRGINNWAADVGVPNPTLVPEGSLQRLGQGVKSAVGSVTPTRQQVTQFANLRSVAGNVLMQQALRTGATALGADETTAQAVGLTADVGARFGYSAATRSAAGLLTKAAPLGTNVVLDTVQTFGELAYDPKAFDKKKREESEQQQTYLGSALGGLTRPVDKIAQMGYVSVSAYEARQQRLASEQMASRMQSSEVESAQQGDWWKSGLGPRAATYVDGMIRITLEKDRINSSGMSQDAKDKLLRILDQQQLSLPQITGDDLVYSVYKTAKQQDIDLIIQKMIETGKTEITQRQQRTQEQLLAQQQQDYRYRTEKTKALGLEPNATDEDILNAETDAALKRSKDMADKENDRRDVLKRLNLPTWANDFDIKEAETRKKEQDDLAAKNGKLQTFFDDRGGFGFVSTDNLRQISFDRDNGGLPSDIINSDPAFEDWQKLLIKRKNTENEIQKSIDPEVKLTGYKALAALDASIRASYEQAKKQYISRNNLDITPDELADQLWNDYDAGMLKKAQESQRREKVLANKEAEKQAQMWKTLSRISNIQLPSKFENPGRFLTLRSNILEKLKGKFPLSGDVTTDIQTMQQYGLDAKIAEAIFRPFDNNQIAAVASMIPVSSKTDPALRNQISLLSQASSTALNTAKNNPYLLNIIDKNPKVNQKFKTAFIKSVNDINNFNKMVGGFNQLDKRNQDNARGNLLKRLTRQGYIDPRNPDASIEKLNALGGSNVAQFLFPNKQAQNKAIRIANPKNLGGIIYANNGMLVPYEPRGTDTVPAMLTPGEFVVNKQATSKHRGLLESINRSKGGSVKYLQEGGTAEDMTQVAIKDGVKITKPSEIYTMTKQNLGISKDTNKLGYNTKDILKSNTDDVPLSDKNAHAKLDAILEAIDKCCRSTAEGIEKIMKALADMKVQIQNFQNFVGQMLARMAAAAGIPLPGGGPGLPAPAGGGVPVPPAGAGVPPAVPPGPQNPGRMSRGGLVYASEGTLVNYEPRGTDTVPAMLTPGEFVVNAKSTAQHLPLLKQINSGAMNNGGVVYAQRGGVQDRIEREEVKLRDRTSVYGSASGLPETGNRVETTLGEAMNRSGQSSNTRLTAENMRTVEQAGSTQRQNSFFPDQQLNSKHVEGIIRKKVVIQVRDLGPRFLGRNTPDGGIYVAPWTGFNKDNDALFSETEERQWWGTAAHEIRHFLQNHNKISDERLNIRSNPHLKVLLEAYQSEKKMRSGGGLGPATTDQQIDYYYNSAEMDVRLGAMRGAIRNDTIKKQQDRKVVKVPETWQDFIDRAKGLDENAKAQTDIDSGIKYYYDNIENLIKYNHLDRNWANGFYEQLFTRQAIVLAKGGMVYANNGMLVPYEPRGTDTVPAMLTPGEFVVNRAATQANLPLLQAINNSKGGSINKYSKGGVVYLEDGGEALPDAHGNIHGGQFQYHPVKDGLREGYFTTERLQDPPRKHGMDVILWERKKGGSRTNGPLDRSKIGSFNKQINPRTKKSECYTKRTTDPVSDTDDSVWYVSPPRVGDAADAEMQDRFIKRINQDGDLLVDLNQMLEVAKQYECGETNAKLKEARERQLEKESGIRTWTAHSGFDVINLGSPKVDSTGRSIFKGKWMNWKNHSRFQIEYPVGESYQTADLRFNDLITSDQRHILDKYGAKRPPNQEAQKPTSQCGQWRTWETAKNPRDQITGKFIEWVDDKHIKLSKKIDEKDGKWIVQTLPKVSIDKLSRRDNDYLQACHKQKQVSADAPSSQRSPQPSQPRTTAQEDNERRRTTPSGPFLEPPPYKPPTKPRPTTQAEDQSETGKGIFLDPPSNNFPGSRPPTPLTPGAQRRAKTQQEADNAERDRQIRTEAGLDPLPPNPSSTNRPLPKQPTTTTPTQIPPRPSTSEHTWLGGHLVNNKPIVGNYSSWNNDGVLIKTRDNRNIRIDPITWKKFATNIDRQKVGTPLPYAKGGVVYAQYGGLPENQQLDAIDIFDPNAMKNTLNSLSAALLPYTSNEQGQQKLLMATNQNYGISGIRQSGLPSGASAMFDLQSRNLVFRDRVIRSATAKHEMAHALANSTHVSPNVRNQQFAAQMGDFSSDDAMQIWETRAQLKKQQYLDEGIDPKKVEEQYNIEKTQLQQKLRNRTNARSSIVFQIGQELVDNNYQKLADTSYSIDQLDANPNELFAIIASIADTPEFGNMPASQAFLRKSMQTIGYSKGGIVYAQKGGLEGVERLQKQIDAEMKGKMRTIGSNLLGNPNATIPQIIDVLRKKQNQRVIDSLAKKYLPFKQEIDRRANENAKAMTWTQNIPTDIKPPKSPMDFASGGVVYASEGTLVNYQPRGTDTVPAMLTPGEFVVNRNATQANLPLLQSINSGNYADGGTVLQRGSGSSTPTSLKQLSYEPLIQSIRYLTQSNINLAQINSRQTATPPNIVAPQNNNLTQIFNGVNQQLTTFASLLGRVTQGLISPTQTNITNNPNGVNNVDGLSAFTQTFNTFINQLSSIRIPETITMQLAPLPPIQIVLTGAEALASIEPGLQRIISSRINEALSSFSNNFDGINIQQS